MRDAINNQDRYYRCIVPVKRFYLKPLEHSTVMKTIETKISLFRNISLKTFQFLVLVTAVYLHLHTSQYSAEETDHA